MSGLSPLFYAYTRQFINGFKWMNREKLIKILLFGTIGIAFIIGDFYFFYRIFTHLKVLLKTLPMKLGAFFDIGEMLVIQLFTVINLTFFSMLLFSNVVVSLSTIYLSRDLYLLLSSPLRLTTIFISKFFHTLLNSSYMVLIFGLPIYVAFGVVYDAGLYYYPLSFLMLLLFLFIPAGIGIIVTMLLMRFFPAKKTHQALTFLGLIFAAGIVMFLRFMRPERFFYQEVADNVLYEFFEKLNVPDLPYMPSSWLTSSLLELKNGLYSEFFTHLGYMAVAAVTVFGLTVFIATRIYYMGWQGAKETNNIRLAQKPNSKWTKIWTNIPFFFNKTQKGLFKKDVIVFFRDSTQWSQIFILLALIVIYLFNMKNIPIDTMTLKNLISFLNLGLAGFIIAAVSIRFVFPTTSIEAGGIWIIATAPVDYRSFIIEKFLLFLFPLLIIAETLIYFSNVLLKVHTFFMTLSLVTMFFITIAVTALGVGMGAIYPKFDYKSSAEISSSTGAILYMIFSLVYIVVIIILEVYPVYSYYFHELPYGKFDVTGAGMFFVVALLITIAVTVIPLKLGIKSLREMEF